MKSNLCQSCLIVNEFVKVFDECPCCGMELCEACWEEHVDDFYEEYEQEFDDETRH